jgi:adenylate kinase
MKSQLVLLGAPGSGKGTQAKMLIDLGYKHISTGDLLRSEVAKKSDLGNRISEIINSGKLVDDQTVLELLKVNCDLKSNEYIFDGFPRNIDQTKALDEVVLNGHASKAIYFDLDLSVLLQRLVNRRTCRDCGNIHNMISNPPKVDGNCDSCGGEIFQRKDDNEETVNSRLEVFRSTIEPILDYYQSKGQLHRVDASLSPEKVSLEISKIL